MNERFWSVHYDWDAMVLKNAQAALDAIQSDHTWRQMQAGGRDAPLAWSALNLHTVSLVIGSVSL
jgi:hypothetical protein